MNHSADSDSDSDESVCSQDSQSDQTNPILAVEHDDLLQLYDDIELHGTVRANTVQQQTRLIHEEIGGLATLRRFFERFYELVFANDYLNTFVTDPSEPHADRFARWLGEKMTGDPLWSADREGMRSISHAKAWHCPHRSERIGLRFKVHDCRAWMRLNMLAARQVGLAENRNFMTFYIPFIAHFIAVYERKAPPFLREAISWSADQTRTEQYLRGGGGGNASASANASSSFDDIQGLPN
jgi:truncated hemoglobin YjbI